MEEAIKTWLVYQSLKSYRKTGREVFAGVSTVWYRVDRVNRLLSVGELEYVGGVVKQKD